MLLSLAALAHAGAIDACCAAVGVAACPDTVKVVGPSSTQVAGTDGTTLITGLWTLSCAEAPKWEPTATSTASRSYPAGTVLTPMLPTAAQCFEAAATLPAGACLHTDAGRVVVAACAEAAPLDESGWHMPPRPGHTPVVVNGRVLGATGSAPAPAPVTVSPAPGVPVPAGSPVDPKVPAAPPERCNTNPALREPSNQQVDLGNEAVVKGNPAEAAERYRAAITINACNAFAWTALGEVLAGAGHLPPATTALEVSGRLMPANAHTWTVLGQVKERVGDRAAAAEAYRKALAAKPDHPPAVEGLRRTQ